MDELDRYDVYVSECDHCISIKTSDLEQDHELGVTSTDGGDWCDSSDVKSLEDEHSEALADKEVAESDLEALQEKFDKLLSAVDEVLLDANEHEIRGYYMIDNSYIDSLQEVFDGVS